jgi:hypothetical protein
MCADHDHAAADSVAPDQTDDVVLYCFQTIPVQREGLLKILKIAVGCRLDFFKFGADEIVRRLNAAS